MPAELKTTLGERRRSSLFSGSSPAGLPFHFLIRSLSLEDQRFLMAAALAAVTIFVFWPVCRFDFVNYDDQSYVYSNPHVATGISADNLLWAFTSLHGGTSYWHPLTWISHQLDCTLFGLRPGAHHLTNLLLHTVNSLLVFAFLFRATRRLWPSWVVGVVFAVHPLHIESVAWVSERKDLLSTLFLLLALMQYVTFTQIRQSRNYVAALLLYLCALMSKPMVVTLPLLMLLLDYWPLNRFLTEQNCSTTGDRASAARRWLLQFTRLFVEKIPFLAMSLGIGALTILAQMSLVGIDSLLTLTLGARFANAIVASSLYLGKMFLPLGLSVLYPHPGSWPIHVICSSAVLVGSVFVFAVLKRRSFPYVTVGIFWFFIALLPVLGLVQSGVQSMADRYSYIPSIGLLVAVTWLLAALTERCHAFVRSSLFVSAVCSLCTLTIHHLPTWENSVSLFKNALKTTPLNPVAHNNLGVAVAEEGHISEALEHYLEAIKGNPGYTMAWKNAGSALRKLNRPLEAVSYYQHAQQAGDGATLTVSLIGEAYLEAGIIDKAISTFDAALAKDRSLLIPHARLARIFACHTDLRFRNPPRALHHSSAAARITFYRDAMCVALVASAFASNGDFAEARHFAEKAHNMALAAKNAKLAALISTELQGYRNSNAVHIRDISAIISQATAR